MGRIESGVKSDLRKLGISRPKSALEMLAIRLAQLLDSEEIDDRQAAGIARELRLTMAAIASQPAPETDRIADLARKVQEK
jgi:hypothetical protein